MYKSVEADYCLTILLGAIDFAGGDELELHAVACSTHFSFTVATFVLCGHSLCSLHLFRVLCTHHGLIRTTTPRSFLFASWFELDARTKIMCMLDSKTTINYLLDNQVAKFITCWKLFCTDSCFLSGAIRFFFETVHSLLRLRQLRSQDNTHISQGNIHYSLDNNSNFPSSQTGNGTTEIRTRNQKAFDLLSPTLLQFIYAFLSPLAANRLSPSD